MTGGPTSSLRQSFPSLIDDTVVLDGRTYARHPRHWYDDGSFGFLIEKTAFLPHRSLLAKRSSAMADLFSLPQYPRSEVSEVSDDMDHKPGNISGIPFVVLQDKAEDFANVLDIIYTDITMASEKCHLDLAALMGVIRLSNKYLFDKVKEWGVSQVLSSQLLPVVEDESLRPHLPEGLYSDPRFCVQVVQFSRECHLPQFLPVAFYALATTDWSRKSSEDFFSIDKLSAEDRWRIQEGRLALTKSLLDKAYKMPENGCTGERCADDPNCRKGLPGLWHKPTKRWRELQLHPLEELELGLPPEYVVLCEACRTSLQPGTKALRDDLVSHLPEFFRLTSS
ncbi:hypothetical protein FRC04_005712 [Tulasnella sp. 424]|nr:hypothetical protein FRC04_005712 [Tulasnella sp. 424]